MTCTDYNGSVRSGTLEYDALGNPTKYFNGDKNWNFSWKFGRRLVSATDGTNTIANDYDVDGIRRSKTVNGVEHVYETLDGKIIREAYGTTTIDYFYDNEGKPYKIVIDENGTVTEGWFVLNQQGDVIAIVDSSGNVVVQYSYNAWGRKIGQSIEANTAGSKLYQYNALRYRGYYYDAETGFYYVSSRYYDPVIGRFISADGRISGVDGELLGYNMYTYCFNNPINMDDQDGNWPRFIKKAVKWVTKNIVKPITKKVKKVLSKVNRTYSSGVNVSATPSIFCFNAQGGVSVDTKGNVAVQGSFSGGVTGGTPSASITVYQSKTNAPNINKLEGLGYQLGGSIGVPVYGVPLAAGADFNIIPDSALGKTYFGATTNIGFGVRGGELHIEWARLLLGIGRDLIFLMLWIRCALELWSGNDETGEKFFNLSIARICTYW